MDSSVAVNSSDTTDRGEQEGPTRRKNSYDFKFKLAVVEYAENHSQSATAANFGIDAKRIREWKKQKPVLVVMSSSEIVDDGRINETGGDDADDLQCKVTAAEVCQIKEEVDDDDDDGVALTESEDDSLYIEDSEDEDINLPGVLLPQSRKGDKGVDGGDVRRIKNQFTLKQKLEAIRYAETHSVNATSRFFGVATKSVREWKKRKDIIERLVREELMAYEQGTADDESPAPRKRIPGAGRKKRTRAPPKVNDNPNKRQRRSLLLNEKVEIIKLIESGMTQSDVARQLRFSQSTVQTIWSNKHQILMRHMNPKKKWKNLRWKPFADVNEALLEWYNQTKQISSSVHTNKSLVAKAIEFAEYFKKPEFKAEAERWVAVFKKRHGITLPNLEDNCQSDMNQNHSNLPTTNHNQPYQSSLASHSHPPPVTNSTTVGGGTLSSQPHHQLIPDFDVSSLPNFGLYPPDTTNSSGEPEPPPPNFNSISSTTPVTTCDAMKYVELIRNWTDSTYGHVGPSAETLHNHLNAIENLILKRRMTEMQDPVNNSNSPSHR